MGLETATTIGQLNANWPLGTDPRSQGDDHLRLIKAVVKNDALPKSGGTMTGALRLEASTPRIVLRETDIPLPGGLFEMRSSTGGLRAVANTAIAGDFSTEQTIWRYLDTTTLHIDVATRVNSSFGVGSNLNFGVCSDGVTVDVNTISCVGSMILQGGSTSGGSWIRLFDSALNVIGRVDGAGTAANNIYTVMTREKGDFRYALKTTLLAALAGLGPAVTPAELRDALLAALLADPPPDPPGDPDSVEP